MPHLVPDLEDRLRGLLLGAAVGDLLGSGEPAGWAAALLGSLGRGGGQRAAVSTADALLACGDDADAFRERFRYRTLGEEGRFGPPSRLVYPARATVRSAVVGAFMVDNPWLRYRFAAAVAAPPSSPEEFDLAAGCHMAARAAALALLVRPGAAPRIADVAPTGVLADMGVAARRAGLPPVPRTPLLLQAASLWETVCLVLESGEKSGLPTQAVMEQLVVDLDIEGWEYGDAPLAVYAWTRSPRDIRTACSEAAEVGTTGGAAVLAGMLVGATVGRAGLPADLLEEVDCGPLGVGRLDAAGARLSAAATLRPGGGALPEAA